MILLSSGALVSLKLVLFPYPVRLLNMCGCVLREDMPAKLALLEDRI